MRFIEPGKFVFHRRRRRALAPDTVERREFVILEQIAPCATQRERGAHRSWQSLIVWRTGDCDLTIRRRGQILDLLRQILLRFGR